MTPVTRNSREVKTKTMHRHLGRVGNGKTNSSNHLGDESCDYKSRVETTASSCCYGGKEVPQLATRFFASAHLFLQEVLISFKAKSDIRNMTENCEFWLHCFLERDAIQYCNQRCHSN